MDLIPGNHSVILFDGVCNLCNGFVNFIIDHDPGMKFRFAPLQSEKAHIILKQIGIHDIPGETIIFISEGKIYTRSRAIIEISKIMNGFWYSISYFRFLPIPFLDFFYNLVAGSRYKIFGKQNQCRIPSGEIMKRFL